MIIIIEFLSIDSFKPFLIKLKRARWFEMTGKLLWKVRKQRHQPSLCQWRWASCLFALAILSSLTSPGALHISERGFDSVLLLFVSKEALFCAHRRRIGSVSSSE